MKQLPIRLRLTLWYSMVFAVAALLLSVTSWWMLRRTIDATVHQDLQERTDDVRLQLLQLHRDASQQAQQAAIDATYRYRDDGKWLQIRSEDGSWVYRSERMTQWHRDLGVPAALPLSGFQRDDQQRGRIVRTLSSRVQVNGLSYSVETGISMTKPRLLLHDFGLGLILLTPAVLLLAAGAGHFMSRKALTPVAVIAYEARRITDRNLDKRLPVSTSNDELSHLSTTLNHMLARIDSSFRSVRDFTANASHELRTPLARIRTEAELSLLRPRIVDEYKESLEQIYGDATEMSALIDNLLVLARAEAGREVLRLDPVDLRPLIGEIIDEWSTITARLSITLTSSSDSVGGSIVLGDRTALVRLLRIWLDNACKFTPAGGSIRVLTEVSGEVTVLAVEDTGIGIAPEEHARIFERFYRVNTQNSRQKEGAGLGLSLAVWIAEQHRTRITMRSACGKGTRFEITLRQTNVHTDLRASTVPSNRNELVMQQDTSS